MAAASGGRGARRDPAPVDEPEDGARPEAIRSVPERPRAGGVSHGIRADRILSSLSGMEVEEPRRR